MLLDLISSAPQYRMLLAAMAKRGWPAQMTGLGHIHKAAVTAALSETGPFIVVTPDEAMATRLCEDVNAFAGKKKRWSIRRGNSLSGMWRGLAGNMSLPG